MAICLWTKNRTFLLVNRDKKVLLYNKMDASHSLCGDIVKFLCILQCFYEIFCFVVAATHKKCSSKGKYFSFTAFSRSMIHEKLTKNFGGALTV